MTILTQLSHKDINFALSNVIEHKGQKNSMLLKWVKDNKYHIHRIKFNYDNCNYHTQNKRNITTEVLITNY